MGSGYDEVICFIALKDTKSFIEGSVDYFTKAVNRTVCRFVISQPIAFSVFGGCHSGFFPEQFHKVIAVRNPHIFTYLHDIFACTRKKGAGFFDSDGPEIVHGTCAGFFFEFRHKVTFGYCEFTCDILDGYVIFEIAVQKENGICDYSTVNLRFVLIYGIAKIYDHFFFACKYFIQVSLPENFSGILP